MSNIQQTTIVSLCIFLTAGYIRAQEPIPADPWESGSRVIVKSDMKLDTPGVGIVKIPSGTPARIVEAVGTSLRVRVFDKLLTVPKSAVYSTTELVSMRHKWFGLDGKFIGQNDPIGLSYAITCGFARATDPDGLRRLTRDEIRTAELERQGDLLRVDSSNVSGSDKATSVSASEAGSKSTFSTAQIQLSKFLDAVALQSRIGVSSDQFHKIDYVAADNSATEQGKRAYLLAFESPDEAIQIANSALMNSPGEPSAYHWRMLVNCLVLTSEKSTDSGILLEQLNNDLVTIERLGSASSIPYAIVAVAEMFLAKKQLKTLDFSSSKDDPQFTNRLERIKNLYKKAQTYDGHDPILTDISLFISLLETGYSSLRDQKRVTQLDGEYAARIIAAAKQQPWNSGFATMMSLPEIHQRSEVEKAGESAASSRQISTLLMPPNWGSHLLRLPGSLATTGFGHSEWLYGGDPLSCLIPKPCSSFKVLPIANDPLRFSVEITADELTSLLAEDPRNWEVLEEQSRLLEINLNVICDGDLFYMNLLESGNGVRLFRQIDQRNRQQGRNDLAFDWTQPPGWRVQKLEQEAIELGKKYGATIESSDEARLESAKQARLPLRRIDAKSVGDRKMAFGSHLDRLIVFQLGYRPSAVVRRALASQFNLELNENTDFAAVWQPLVIAEQIDNLEVSFARFKDSLNHVAIKPPREHYLGYQQFLEVQEKMGIGGNIAYMDSLELQLAYLFVKGFHINPHELLEQRITSLINSREDNFFKTGELIRKAAALTYFIDQEELQPMIGKCQSVMSELNQLKSKIKVNLAED